MKKLTDEQVETLVNRFLPKVAEMGTDPGVTPKDYLRHIFASKEFYAFSVMLSRVPGSYEDNIQDIIRDVLPETFPLMVEWISAE